MSNSAQVKAWRARVKGQEPPNHGASGFSNYGCRCKVCVEANKEKCLDHYYKKWMERHTGEDPTFISKQETNQPRRKA